MRNTVQKSALILATSLAMASTAHAFDYTFFDGFEAPLPYVKTKCGFYDKTSKLTWSNKSFECEAGQTAVQCLAAANKVAQCKGELPTYTQLVTTKSLDLFDTKKDGLTIIKEPYDMGGKKVIGLDFGKKESNIYEDQSADYTKRYARLVMMSS